MNKDLLESVYGLGKHIALIKSATGWRVISLFDSSTWNYWKLIHKKHESILDAYLKDSDVEIESVTSEYNDWSLIKGNFIESYNENTNYRLKQKETPQEYITVLNGEVKFLMPKFEHKIYDSDDILIYGRVGFLPVAWNLDGMCIMGMADKKELNKFNLTPYIEPKPWYEDESNFPCVIYRSSNNNKPFLIGYYNNNKLVDTNDRTVCDVSGFDEYYRLAKDEEIDALKKDKD